MTKVFLAHPKAWGDEEIERWKAALTAELGIEVVPGRDDYLANIASDGHIRTWISGVTSRRDRDTGEPVYSLFVLPTDRVGKATADILRDALKAGARVAYVELDETDSVRGGRPVSGIEQYDREDYFTGWGPVFSL